MFRSALPHRVALCDTVRKTSTTIQRLSLLHERSHELNNLKSLSQLRKRHVLSLHSGARFHTRASSHIIEDSDADKNPKVEFTVTTPLYYVNAAPHMGSAYPTIAADSLARFQRLRGRKVKFVTGTDEHGEKIALAAAANGRTPQEHVDAVVEDYKSLWKKLNISHDSFIRTTQERHEKTVKEFLQRVWDNGDIYRAQYEGLYCIACEEYKDEKDLIEDKCCPTHRKPCVERKEDNFFFALSKYQGALESLFEKNPQFVRPSFRKNEVMGWVSEGARDFSISRSAVQWGIPVPSEPSQTIYVWFDALVGYLTALLDDSEHASSSSSIDAIMASGHWPASVHIIGKDILRFHAVYWPAMLLSAGLPVPEAVYGHGFLTKDGLKMGKSVGNTVDPVELVDGYGCDAVRYFLMSDVEFGKDGDFSQQRFINIVNAQLANTLGNLLNRTLGLLAKNCGGAIAMDLSTVPLTHPLRQLATTSVDKVAKEYSKLQFSAACEAAMAVATAGNLYMDGKAPWSKFKLGGQEAIEAAQDLSIILEVVRIVGLLLSPIVPNLSLRIHTQLGFTAESFQSLSWGDAAWGGLTAGHQTAAPSPVFQRIEDSSASQGESEGSKGGKKGKTKQKSKKEKAEGGGIAPIATPTVVSG